MWGPQCKASSFCAWHLMLASATHGSKAHRLKAQGGSLVVVASTAFRSCQRLVLRLHRAKLDGSGGVETLAP